MEYFTKMLFLCLPLFAIACSRTEMPIDPCITPCDTLQPFETKIAWHNPIQADTSEAVIGKMVAASNRFIYVRIQNSFEGTVVARDNATGEVLWQWGDPAIATGLEVSSLEVVEGKLVIESWSDLYVVDISNGHTIWKSTAGQTGSCGSPRMSVIGNQIYFIVEDCSDEKKYTKMMRTPLSHFSPEAIYTIEQATSGPDSGWISGLERPAFWLSPQGDSVLVFQNRSIKLGGLQSKVDLFAYNLKTKSLVWKIDSITQEGKSSIHLPIVYDNFIYFVGYYSVHKIEAATGTKLWSKSFPAQNEHFIYSTITVSDRAVFAQPGAGTLYALDANSGSQIWAIDKIACCGLTGEMQMTEAILNYVSPPYFLAVDTKKGEVASKDLSPFRFGTNYQAKFEQFARTISSPDKKLLFTSDDHYIMAVRVD